MQSFHSFFPHYPPPPLPTRESIINEGLKNFEQTKIDQQWLKIWIERKQKDKKLSSNKISLCNYRQKLIQHAHLLQQYNHALENFNHEILFELKSKIEQSNNFIYDSNIIKNIQQQIYQRKSKRARVRRQREKLITNPQIEIIKESSTNKKTLIEKIQDINSILQTIEQLKQLKNIRQQTEKDNNNDELTEIQNLCTDKLIEYQNEMKNKSQYSHVELYNYLFNNQNQSFYESTNSDAQDFLRAHQNLNNLVQIRQTWDQYLNTRISSLDDIIPFKWHEPQVPSDSNWARYIFNKQEQILYTNIF